MAEDKVKLFGGRLDGTEVTDPGKFRDGDLIAMKDGREVYRYDAARDGRAAELHFVGYGDPTLPGNDPAAAAALMDVIREPYQKLEAALAELERACESAGGFPTGVIRIGRWEVRRVIE